MAHARRRGVHDELCATPDCPNRARFISIHEGNREGSNAPYRCSDCCNRIDDEMIAAYQTEQAIKAYGWADK